LASVPLLVKKDFHPLPGAMVEILRARKYSGYVLELVHLRVNRLVHLFVAVTDAHGQDAAEEVQVLVAVGIPDELVFGSGQHQRLAEVVENSREQTLLVGQNDFFLGHGLLPAISMSQKRACAIISPGPHAHGSRSRPL
jgi:hypothetical protein